MDQLIVAADFMRPSSDDNSWQELMETFKKWYKDNSESLNCDMVKRCWKTFHDKVCRTDFPGESSSGYYIGYHLITVLKNMTKDVLDAGKGSTGDFHQIYLDIIIGLIESGPGSSHIQYFVILYNDSVVEFKHFFQNLRGEELAKVVRALKKVGFHGDTNNTKEKYYSASFEKFRIMSCDTLFSPEQYRDAQRDFMAVYLFFNLDFRDHEEIVRKAMHSFASRIKLRLERNVFKMQGQQDVALLRSCWERVGEVILLPQFPHNEQLAEESKSDLSCILNVISEFGLIGNMYEPIMDLACNLTIYKSGNEATLKHFATIGNFFYQIKEGSVKNNEELFEGLITKLIYFLDHVKDEVYLTYRFVTAICNNCLNKAMGVSEAHVKLWISMIKALLRHSIPECIDAAYRSMREKEKLLKWKNYPNDIKEIFALMTSVSFPKWLTAKQVKQGMDELKNLASHFLEAVQKVGIAKLELTGPMLQFVYHCVDMRTTEFYSLGYEVSQRMEYNPKKDKALMNDVIQFVINIVEDDSYDLATDKARRLETVLIKLVDKVVSCVKDGKIYSLEEYEDLIYLSKVCQTKLLELDDSGYSVFLTIYTIISYKVIVWLRTMNEIQRLIPLIPGMIKMFQTDNDSAKSTAASQMSLISQSAGVMLARYLEDLVVLFLDSECDDILSTIIQSFEFNPDPVAKHFDEIFQYVDTGDSSLRNYIQKLLQKVAKVQPQLLTSEKLDKVMQEAKEDQLLQPLFMNIFADLAKRSMDQVAPYVDDFMQPELWNPHCANIIISILQLFALHSEANAERVVPYLLSRAQKSNESTEILCSLSACRLIGFKHRSPVEKRRSQIEQFIKTTSNNDHHAIAQAVLDMLDGKSLDKIADELTQLQEDVGELDARVTSTERNIQEISSTVQLQGDKIEIVKNDVSQQGQRLDKVTDKVDVTVAKVQEIDGKTLSHAPHWARDVAKLLNVESDKDWRLLSLRLGYNNKDIRAWAQHVDPCMAMLNEWYTTHKTREATHAVLTSLQLLDRTDAVAIVENAMKNAEAVVQDEEFEYATPPDIFLSYQWGHQNEVRLLRQHLEMAGVSCWMDVGQMGGGDKLFEKIDIGIREAKVNLSVNLGKPIIPLQMEKMNWPPSGSMGPIFSEYLFIRFFQRQGEETEKGDMRFWPLVKFQELLMQLSVNGVKPDTSVVKPEYKSCWMPKVEEVIVDKDRTKKQKDPIPDELKQASNSPNVFISYQWGRQPQILKLYKKLTSLGYNCWLDIMQMGGGDSLYDKIDRGLRGCQVILSCVTSKYALSANCRREISLADNLKKPIIPLLLESLTWPPSGPMAPILTQLQYVDFSQDSVEDSWEGPKFDEILAMISKHIPSPSVLTGANTDLPKPKSAAETLEEKKMQKKEETWEKDNTENLPGKKTAEEKDAPAPMKNSLKKMASQTSPPTEPTSEQKIQVSQNKQKEEQHESEQIAEPKKADEKKPHLVKQVVTTPVHKKAESRLQTAEVLAPSGSAPKSDSGQATASNQAKSCTVL